jgi:hypothetical protein
MPDMYMRPGFFSRKEVKAEASNARDCGAHIYRIPATPGEQPRSGSALDTSAEMNASL